MALAVGVVSTNEEQEMVRDPLRLRWNSLSSSSNLIKLAKTSLTSSFSGEESKEGESESGLGLEVESGRNGGWVWVWVWVTFNSGITIDKGERGEREEERRDAVGRVEVNVDVEVDVEVEVGVEVGVEVETERVGVVVERG